MSWSTLRIGELQDAHSIVILSDEEDEAQKPVASKKKAAKPRRVQSESDDEVETISVRQARSEVQPTVLEGKAKPAQKKKAPRPDEQRKEAASIGKEKDAIGDSATTKKEAGCTNHEEIKRDDSGRRPKRASAVAAIAKLADMKPEDSSVDLPEVPPVDTDSPPVNVTRTPTKVRPENNTLMRPITPISGFDDDFNAALPANTLMTPKTPNTPASKLSRMKGKRGLEREVEDEEPAKKKSRLGKPRSALDDRTTDEADKHGVAKGPRKYGNKNLKGAPSSPVLGQSDAVDWDVLPATSGKQRRTELKEEKPISKLKVSNKKTAESDENNKRGASKKVSWIEIAVVVRRS